MREQRPQWQGTFISLAAAPVCERGVIRGANTHLPPSPSVPLSAPCSNLAAGIAHGYCLCHSAAALAAAAGSITLCQDPGSWVAPAEAAEAGGKKKKKKKGKGGAAAENGGWLWSGGGTAVHRLCCCGSAAPILLASLVLLVRSCCAGWSCWLTPQPTSLPTATGEAAGSQQQQGGSEQAELDPEKAA